MRNKRRTREEILAYHREYNKTYKNPKRVVIKKINMGHRTVIVNRQEQDYKLLNSLANNYIKNMPVPFGSFDKATYLIYVYEKTIFYRFTTTCHNLEECIKIMVDKYLLSGLSYCTKSFKIHQIKNGIEKVVYEYVYFKNSI